ncbi:MAG: efflux RND transporter permease subunit [Sphingobacteriaceae bacterium]
MWARLSKFILANRSGILIFFLLATIFMGWQASKVRLSFNAGKVLPLSDSAYIKYNNFKKQFGEDGSVMVLGIQSDKLLKRDLFNDWLQLNNEIQQIKGIRQVVSIGKLFELTKDTTQQKFIAKPIAVWPVKTQGAMDSIANKIANLPFYKDLIYNPEKQSTLMAVTFADSVLNSSQRIAVIQTILDKSKNFSQKHQVAVHHSGLPYIRTVISKKVSEEFALFIGLSILVAALILFLFFRSFSSVFFPVLVVLIGVVWSLGTLVLLGYDITLLTGLIPPLIVVIGIPNSILLINKYHNEFTNHGDKQKALKTVIERIAITTLIANLTTAIGFGVLYFTNSELLMQFGIVAALNVMATWLMSLCLIPIIFSFLPPPHVKHTRHLDSPFLSKLLLQLDYLAHNRRKLIYVSTIFILIIAVWGISRVRVNGYIVDDLPQKDAVYQDMKFFSQNFKGVLPLEVSVDTRRKNGVMNLSVIKKIDRVQDLISSHPEFSRAISLVEVLKFSSQAFYVGDTAFYRVPNDMEKNFILSYAANSGKSNNNLMKNFLDSNRQVTRLSFQMADVGSDRMNQLIKEIEPGIDSIFNPARYDVELTGSSIIFIKGTNYLVKNLRDSLLLAIALIALLMWILFRGGRMILISLIPNIIPLIITAGILGFAGIPLKPSTILIFSIAFGIASDQTIYFLTRYRQELRNTNWSISQIVTDTIKETGLSMIYVAMILFFGFGIFAASTFGGTVALGLLLSITLLVALISNLTLLPAFLLSLEKRNLKKAPKPGLINLEPEELS